MEKTNNEDKRNTLNLQKEKVCMTNNITIYALYFPVYNKKNKLY